MLDAQCCKIGPSATSTKLSINALRTGFGMVAWGGVAAGCWIWLPESSVLRNFAKKNGQRPIISVFLFDEGAANLV